MVFCYREPLLVILVFAPEVPLGLATTEVKGPWMPTDISANDRVRLRLIDIADVPYLVEGLNDWSIVQWLPTVPFPYREEDAQTFIVESLRTSPPSAYVVADSTAG